MDSKEAICKGLRELVLAYPFDSISIQGVCNKAGLSRKTFSRNFASLEEVVAHQMYLDFIEPMCELHEIMEKVPYGTAITYERNLTVLRDNAEYYARICRKFGGAWFVEQYARISLSINFEPYEKHNLQGAELNFVKDFFAHAAAEASRWWLEGGMTVPEKEMAALIEKWLYARCLEGESA